MFSATMPPELNRVANEALRDPARVDLAPPQRPAAGITQAVYPVARHLKTDLLDSMLSQSEVSSVIVFARTKHGADKLARDLQRRGHSVATLHGNRSQSQRERALLDLRRGRVQVLVATDIASRGIDVEGITHVINYDVPHAPEDYVHRIGRTGRVDAVGDAFTLIAPEEMKQLSAIERFLGRAVPRVILPDFDYKRRPSAGSPAGPRVGTNHGGGRPRGGPGSGPRGRSHAPGGRGHGHAASGEGRGRAPGSSGGGQGRPNQTSSARGAESQQGPQHGRRPRKSHGMDRRNRRRI